MNEVLIAAAELQAVCGALRWRFCFIGGVALLRWGQPRETVDADLSLLTGFGGEAEFVDELLKHFTPRIKDARSFALEQRVLLLQSATGVGLDVTLAGIPFEELAIERASDFEYAPGITLRTCSADDLVVMKAFAGRRQDWADIERILVRQSRQLDWEYIERELAPLLEITNSQGSLAQLRQMRSANDRNLGG